MSATFVHQRLRQSTLVRHVLTLMSGTVLSQVIPILISPLLTRIYSTADFGELGAFMAVTTLAAVAANLRYSIAILVADDSDDGFALLGLSLGLSAVLVALMSVVLFGCPSLQPMWMRQMAGRVWLPLAVFSLSVNTCLYAWINRNRKFQLMANSKVVQSVVGALLSLVFGWLMVGDAYGLIYGYVAGLVVSPLMLAWAVWREDQARWPQFSFRRMRDLGWKFARFATVSLPADFLNTFTNQLPVILFGAFFSTTTVGLFNMTNRVMLMPMALIATAVLDVFKERASRDFESTGTCRPIFVKTLYVLLGISTPLFLLVALVAPTLFGWVFGPDWVEAGRYCQCLTPLFILRFAATPLSYVLYIAQKQSYDLAWQIGLFVGIWIALQVGGRSQNPLLCMWLFSSVYSVGYVIYLVLAYRCTVRDAVKGTS